MTGAIPKIGIFSGYNPAAVKVQPAQKDSLAFQSLQHLKQQAAIDSIAQQKKDINATTPVTQKAVQSVGLGFQASQPIRSDGKESYQTPMKDPFGNRTCVAQTNEVGNSLNLYA